MSRIEKLIERYKNNPASLKYADVEKILIHIGCEKIQAKGSHVKFKHTKLLYDIVIPLHNNDCKAFYKNQTKKMIHKLLP